MIREIPLADPLVRQIRSVLRYTEETPVWLLVVITGLNGIAEELFFRGAAYAASRGTR